MSITPENDERMQILEMIADGKISASDGIRLLAALNAESGDDDGGRIESSVESSPSLQLDDAFSSVEDRSQVNEDLPSEAVNEEIPVRPEVDQVLIAGEVLAGDPPTRGVHSKEEYVRKEIPNPKVEKWKRWWLLPLWVGVGVTVAAGLLMFWVFQATQISFWFACTWIPFLFGVALIFLAWGLRRSRWLHVRVTQGPGEWPRHIAISLPLPLGLAAWFVRTFKSWIPGMAHTNVDQIIEGMSSITSNEPFYVEVEEGEDGERVEVFIG